MREVQEKTLLTFEFNRIGFLGLGLGPWKNKRAEIVNVVAAALRTMRISKVSRIGFKTTAFLDLGMSHAEICDLMFGSFFQDAKRSKPLCGEPTDAALQVHGKRNGITPLTVINASSRRSSLWMNSRGFHSLSWCLSINFSTTRYRNFASGSPMTCFW